jgi:heterodisulfide reductase subunit A
VNNHEHPIARTQEQARPSYIQMKIARIDEKNGRVRILGLDHLQNKRIELEVDLAVLALPMIPSIGTKDLANLVQLEINERIQPREMSEKLRSVESATPGVFVAGCAHTPMDVPSAMTQASLAASKVIEILTEAVSDVNE